MAEFTEDENCGNCDYFECGRCGITDACKYEEDGCEKWEPKNNLKK